MDGTVNRGDENQQYRLRMASTAVLGAAVAVFVVAALLFWQSQQQGISEGFNTEGFTQSQNGYNPRSTTEGFRALPPIAGRPYGAVGQMKSTYFVPADLAKAPIASSAAASVPSSNTRPNTVPGPAAAPRDLPATQKDLQELDMRLTLWLEAMDQLENEHPGMLTPEQKHQRVIYQARVASIREQLGTGMITDTSRIVADEIADMRRQNQVWKRRFPSLEELSKFGLGRPTDAFLDADEYREFRGLFDAAVNELKGKPQPDPLDRVRFQQLQIFQQDLISSEHTGKPVPIRIGAARLFLTQMLKPDQPLPTLFAMESAEQPKPHAESVSDVLASLKDIEWELTVSHDPASQDLKRAVASLLTDVRTHGPTAAPHQVAAARAHVAALRTARAPVAAYPGVGPSSLMKADYDPSDLITRARTLCRQIREALGDGNAEALGCPVWGTHSIETKMEAENAINTVCDRLRTSVPTVDPAQFNCPRGRV
jgi:hypothetical protein